MITEASFSKVTKACERWLLVNHLFTTGLSTYCSFDLQTILPNASLILRCAIPLCYPWTVTRSNHSLRHTFRKYYCSKNIRISMLVELKSALNKNAWKKWGKIIYKSHALSTMQKYLLSHHSNQTKGENSIKHASSNSMIYKAKCITEMESMTQQFIIAHVTSPLSVPTKPHPPRQLILSFLVILASPFHNDSHVAFNTHLLTRTI